MKQIMGVFIFLIVFGLSTNISYAKTLDFNYSEIFENHKLVRLIIDVETSELIRVNEAAVAYYGYTREELLKMKITEINTLSLQETLRELEFAAEEKRNFFNFRHRLASGEIRDVEVHSYPFVHQGESYLYSIVIDKTEAVAAAEQLDRNRMIISYLVLLMLFIAVVWLLFLIKSTKRFKMLSYTDQLTKVYSRRYLDEWHSIISNHKMSTSEELSIVMLDVNRFKQINDTYGHLIGDQVLIEVANVLKYSVREHDLVIRYGGDEFVLVLEKTTEVASQKIMERIANELINTTKFEFPVGISYGIVELKGKPNVFDAIGLADKKMYKMKVISE